VRHQSIYSWKRIPAERVLDIERATGVPRHELRPDIYPAPTGGAAAAGGVAGASAPPAHQLADSTNDPAPAQTAEKAVQR